MSISERIKEERIKKGLTQKELAARLGISFQAVGKYENGIVENLPIFRIKQMAEIFSCTPSYLIGVDDFDAKTDEIVEIYKSLSPEKKKEAEQFLLFLLNKQ